MNRRRPGRISLIGRQALNRRRTGRISLVCTVGLVMSLGLPVSPVRAASSSTDSSPVDPDIMREIALNINRYGISADSNYHTASPSRTDHTVTIYRSVDSDGSAIPPPDQVSKYEALAPGLTVEFAQASFSFLEKEKIADAVSAENMKLRDQGIHLVWWSTEEIDGPYVVMYDPAWKPPTWEDFPQMPLSAKGKVVFKESDPMINFSGKDADGSPFYGGSKIRYPGYSYPCSTGFGVRSQINGARYLSSAWHCAKYADARVFNGDFSKLIGLNGNPGSPPAGSTVVDTSYIKVTGTGDNQVAATIYVGARNGTQVDNYRSQPVVSYSSPVRYHEICSSGAIFYVVCGAHVVELTDRWDLESGGQVVEVHGFRVYTDVGRTPIVGSGDSGGPVFYETNGNTAALAVGTISAGLPGWIVDCPSWVTEPNSRCAFGYEAPEVTEMGRINHLDFNFPTG